jgi:hypothetical protein
MSHVRQQLILAGIVSVLVTSANAQSQSQSRGLVDQIGAPQSVGMQQINSHTAPGASLQLSSARDSSPPAQLVNSERGAGWATPQLTRGPRTAQSSEPLSQPRDGRTAAVERVAGSDRCDPRVHQPRLALCVAAIETRAAEFPRRDPTPLSPEQRIIAEQQRDRAGNVSSAARRLAATGNDSDSPEAQGVASLLLARPAPAPMPAKSLDDPALSDQTRALVNAIVNPPQSR